MFNQRNSIGVGVGGRAWSGMGELNGDAHWVGEGGDRGIEVDTGCVEGLEEVD